MFGKKTILKFIWSLKGDLPRCSFCNKSQEHLKKLIAGPKVFICDECVGVCLTIVDPDRNRSSMTAEETSPSTDRKSSAPRTVFLCAVCRIVTPPEASLGVRDRGFLCAGCVAAVEAALAARSLSS